MTSPYGRGHLGDPFLLHEIFFYLFYLARCLIYVNAFPEETLHHELGPRGSGKEELLHKAKAVHGKRKKTHHYAYGYPPVADGEP